MSNFVNPFDEGVSYADFLKSIPKGKSVESHLKGKCSKEQIDWIKTEIKNYKKK
jgi:hypothetical protein